MLITFAQHQGRKFTQMLSRAEQKRFGQFMTPASIASFMALRMVASVNLHHVRVLDPAAGAGVLAAAVVEALLAKSVRPQRIELSMFELDARLLPALRQLATRMAEACRAEGVEFDVSIANADFLLSDLALSGQPVDGLLTIANPPFFKLNKANDVRAQAHAYAVHGQPNIYSLFMAACARLTPANGRWCFITPRSWMAGAYFKAARHSLLRHLTLDSLHAFDSRKEGFEEDAVLQETVIAWATGRSVADAGASVLLTRSRGAEDLDAAQVVALPRQRIVGADDEAMLSLPAEGADPFEGWTATLATFGLEVSTGPVIAFRAAEYIRERDEPGTVPLLWLQHIGQQQIFWPVRKKREHMLASAANAWMMVRNEPMVVMRRFSPKEDERRVTCAAYCGRLPGHVLGLENHLNYIHRPGGRMTVSEARGLSGFLASRVVDGHFRALCGSTQVNATELRRLPLPPLQVIESIGSRLSDKPGLIEIDAVVDRALGIEAGERTAA